MHAFSFFGGSVPILAPDNRKTGVTRNTVDELIVNEQYRRMAEYYGCAVVPARPRRPRDKGSVEAAVGLVERQAMAPLRDRVFLSLAELNAALAAKVGVINARPFQKREGSRESEYLGQEKGSLIPLPAHPCRIVAHKSATVQFNYHVAFEGMYYSAPFTCLRKKADITATATAVAIAVDGERVATHPRPHGAKGQYSTNPGHMPDAHRDYAEWNGDRFRRWAAEKGASVAAVVDAMLRSRTVEQQAYRTCRALLDLGRRHGDDVLEEACSKALEYSRNPSCKTVKTIAAKLAAGKPGEPDGHAYLRGSEYSTARTAAAKQRAEATRRNGHGGNAIDDGQAVRDEDDDDGEGLPRPGRRPGHGEDGLRRAPGDDRGRRVELPPREQADAPAAGGVLRARRQRRRRSI